MEYFNCREMEDFLLSHPAVGEVAVVPGTKTGEEVRAYIVPQPGVFDPDRLLAFFREKLARLNRSGAIEYRESLPMTATGKIYRLELAAPARMNRSS